ncbi:quinone-dependent dihydroorotate dehydrogenase [Thermaerobacillus caldiproteolyticus]|uniref:quinone-dependent dihydroorotate dehydrogenase n=1 Tax=Thermaerobacillus caldiproteolyticus TaxID=247480 RepID=UPI00188C2539|nr:quinone-dependent dihydroorotate dehydrogenase [Anoxybacillus caldiproteolyticus]QPA32544.1 quinone-dependent dihydroorotate dehydrogenase [Anoxybacillus caldiproteolyticus]
MSYALFRNLLFKMDPEKAHIFTIWFLKMMQSTPLLMEQFSRKGKFHDRRLQIDCLGLTFPNPIGLAAGFDKHAEVYPALSSLGFGSIEVGAITPKPQEGNPKPRLYRLQEDKAIINRMGFNSHGIEEAKKRFRTLPRPEIPIGINLGKNKLTPNENAALDYIKGLEQLYNWGDYFVINISSPNTKGLRDLQSSNMLEPLLSSILTKRNELASKHGFYRPIVLKIAPDLNNNQLEEIISVCLDVNIDGIIATNTTVSRDGLTSPHRNQTGGLSGRPLAKRSTEVIYRIFQLTKGKIPIIGSGGVFSGQDAYEKIKAGASLIQVYTGMIYRGPFIANKINHELLQLLNRDKLSNIKEAVGLSHN